MKILQAFLALGLAIIIQLRAIDIWGWSPEFILATLAAFAFFLTPSRLILLSLVAAWVLAWQPGLGQELLALVVLPLVVYFVRKFLPWQSWLSNLILAAGSIVAFYVFADMIPILKTGVFLKVSLSSLGYGALLFYIFKDILGRRPDQKRGIFE